jgi:hypothetical protein
MTTREAGGHAFVICAPYSYVWAPSGGDYDKAGSLEGIASRPAPFFEIWRR